MQTPLTSGGGEVLINHWKVVNILASCLEFSDAPRTVELRDTSSQPGTNRSHFAFANSSGGGSAVFSVAFLVPLARYDKLLLAFLSFLLFVCAIGSSGLLASPAPSRG